jgi:hypothetical protein
MSSSGGVCLNVRASVLDRQGRGAAPGPQYTLVDPAKLSGKAASPAFSFGTGGRQGLKAGELYKLLLRVRAHGAK